MEYYNGALTNDLCIVNRYYCSVDAKLNVFKDYKEIHVKNQNIQIMKLIYGVEIQIHYYEFIEMLVRSY